MIIERGEVIDMQLDDGDSEVTKNQQRVLRFKSVARNIIDRVASPLARTHDWTIDKISQLEKSIGR